MRKLIFAFLLCGIFEYAEAQNVSALKKVAAEWNGEMGEIAGDGIVIQFREDTTGLASFLTRHQLVLDYWTGFRNWAVLGTTEDPIRKIRSIEAENSPLVEELEPRGIYHQDDAPNDPWFSYQWHLQDTLRDGMGWLKARELIKPGNFETIVAILDGGFPVYYNYYYDYWLFHEDIGDTTGYIIGKDFSLEGERRYFLGIQDIGGHGTAVLGIVRAKTDNHKGIAGLTHGYPLKILIDRIWDRRGYGTVDGIARAVIHAVESGARVINISGGGSIYSALIEDVIAYTYEHDVILVCSAGNDSDWGVNYPTRLARTGRKRASGYGNVMGVSAVAKNGGRASYASYGTELIVTAPSNFPTTTPFYNFTLLGKWSMTYTEEVKGTSFSAPIVFSLVSMIRSKNPALDHKQVREIVISTTDTLASKYGWEWNGEGMFNIEHGFGQINFYKALRETEKLTALAALPKDAALGQNYPNPFNPSTIISYALKVPGRVSVAVYNDLGQEVARLVDKEEPAGFYSVSFDASRLPSGVYFYRLLVGKFSETRRMVYVK